MTAQQIYIKITGNEMPTNQIALNDWQIEYVKWLENVAVNHLNSAANLVEEDIAANKLKAEKWDNLCNTIQEFYCDDTGEYNEENPVRKGDLCDIGEVAAYATGWM